MSLLILSAELYNLNGFFLLYEIIFRRLRNRMFCTQLSKEEEALMFVYMTDRVPGREWKTLYCSSAGVADTLLCFRACCPKLLKIAFLKLTVYVWESFRKVTVLLRYSDVSWLW